MTFDELKKRIAKLIDAFEDEAHIDADPNRMIDCSIACYGTLSQAETPHFMWGGESFVPEEHASSGSELPRTIVSVWGDLWDTATAGDGEHPAVIELNPNDDARVVLVYPDGHREDRFWDNGHWQVATD